MCNDDTQVERIKKKNKKPIQTCLRKTFKMILRLTINWKSYSQYITISVLLAER